MLEIDQDENSSGKWCIQRAADQMDEYLPEEEDHEDTSACGVYIGIWSGN